MTEPLIVRLKPKKLVLEALNSKGTYTKIKGTFEGYLTLYPKAPGRNLDFVPILNGLFEGARNNYTPDILKGGSNE